MKVLFIFAGLPHYYNFILSRLNQVDSINLEVIVPQKKGAMIGHGVHETKEGTNFKIHYLEETQAVYGKSKLLGLQEAVAKVSPDIVVTIWPYIIQFVFDRKLQKYLYTKKIKTVYKDIPFRIPKFNEAFKLDGPAYYNENMEFENPSSLKSIINRWSLALIRKKFLNFVDAHVYYTEEAYDIIPTYGVDREKIFIIYNSHDTQRLSNAKERALEEKPVLPENPNRIIHVGRLVKWKKVDLLIDAVEKLVPKFSNIELVVIGTGPEEEALKNMVADKDLENHIIFVGGVYEPAILGNYLLCSAIYVLAGMGGLSINEAMAFDKPVIVSECDGTEKKLVRDGYNGKYFERWNADDLAEKIDLILSDRELLNKMGENSGLIIKNEVNVNTVIKGYIDSFNYVLDTNHWKN